MMMSKRLGFTTALLVSLSISPSLYGSSPETVSDNDFELKFQVFSATEDSEGGANPEDKSNKEEPKSDSTDQKPKNAQASKDNPKKDADKEAEDKKPQKPKKTKNDNNNSKAQGVSAGLSAMELAKKVVNRRIEEIRQNRKPNRVLGRHDFISSSLIENPFVTSHAELRTISGLATYERDSFFDQDNLKHQFAAISQGADLQISFLDRVAIRGGGAGNAYIAVDEDTAQSVAGFGGFNVGGGFKFKILRLGHFQLSTSHNYRYDKNFVSKTGPTWSRLDSQINEARDILGRFLRTNNPRDVVDDIDMERVREFYETDVDTDDIFTESSASWYKGGLQMAFGVNDYIGILLDSKLQYELGDGSLFFEGGAGLSIDLADSTFIPIGLNGFYLRSFPINADEGADSPRPLFIPIAADEDREAAQTEIIGGGIFYTDMKYTDIGIEVDRITRKDLENFELLEAKIRLRVYF